MAKKTIELSNSMRRKMIRNEKKSARVYKSLGLVEFAKDELQHARELLKPILKSEPQTVFKGHQKGVKLKFVDKKPTTIKTEQDIDAYISTHQQIDSEKARAAMQIQLKSGPFEVY